MNARTLAGSVTSEDAAPREGWATSTDVIAACCVSFASTASLFDLAWIPSMVRPPKKIAMATVEPTATRLNPRRLTSRAGASSPAASTLFSGSVVSITLGSVSGMQWLSLVLRFGMLFTTGLAPVHERKHCGHKDQSRDRGKDQTAYDRASQRGILFAAITQSQGHGNHPDNHGQRSHADRAEASKSCLDGGENGVLMLFVTDLCERDHENAVSGGDAHTHDGPHKSGNTESGTRI